MMQSNIKISRSHKAPLVTALWLKSIGAPRYAPARSRSGGGGIPADIEVVHRGGLVVVASKCFAVKPFVEIHLMYT